MLIELVEGFYINPKLVAVVKVADEDTCALFTTGQSAVDGGFTLPFSAEEVTQQINDAEDEEDGESLDDNGETPEDD
jgi:hypothetical protein